MVYSEQQRAITSEASITDIALSTTAAYNDRALQTEQSLSISVSTEVSRALEAEQSLGNVAASYNTRALDAEQSLSNTISITLTAQISTLVYQEQRRAMMAEASIGTASLNTAAQYNSRAIAVEQALSLSIANEVSRAISTEASITLSLTALSSSALASTQALAIALDRSQVTFSSVVVNSSLAAMGSTGVGTHAPAALLHVINGDFITGARRFVQTTSAYSTTSAQTRTLLINAVSEECYFKLIFPFLSPYMGSGYSTVVIEFATFAIENRVTLISNNKYGPNTGNIAVGSLSMSSNQISIPFTFSYNYRIYGFIEAFGDSSFTYSWTGVNN